MIDTQIMLMTTTERHIKSYTEALLAEHHLIGWTVGFNRATKVAGLCNHEEQTIRFSRKLLEARPLADSEMTAKHEIAHAICGPGHGHDRKWKRTYLAMGGTGERCYQQDTIDHSKISYRYTGMCPRGHEHHLSRAIVRPRSCPKCRPDAFDPKYIIKYYDNQTGRPMEYAKPPVRRNRKRGTYLTVVRRG